MLYENINAYFVELNQDQDPEKWAEARTTGIGGSDAGAIMGMNKYSSAFNVYMQKKGVKGFDGNNSTKWGHILEDPIRQLTKDELGVTIETVPGMFRSKEYDFMNANLDGLMYVENELTIGGNTVTGLGGHEIKTSAMGDGFTDEEIPDSYYCQVQHYMAVTGLNWFVLSVLFMNTKTGKHYIIPRSDDFIKTLIEAETDFWENYVMVDKVPEPKGLDSETDYLEKLPLDSVIELDDEAVDLLVELTDIQNKEKELSQAEKSIKDRILLKMAEKSTGFEEADKTTATAGKFKVTYNKTIRKSLDTEAIKKAGLFDQYAKESSYKVLRVSGGKE